MNPQQPYQSPPPVNPSPVPPGTTQPASTQAKLKKSKASLIIVSAAAAILLILSIFLAFRAFVNQGKLNDTYNNGVVAGKKDQQASDAGQIKDISENPWRSYTAPKELGAFIIYFPRNWSLATNSDTSNPLTGLAHPDVVDLTSTQYALRFTVSDTKYDDVKHKYEALVKPSKGKLTESTTTVSGIGGLKFVGAIETKTPDATLVIVPVRDKTFILQTDKNADYGSTFADILNRVKLNP